jgi:hypothetical protein
VTAAFTRLLASGRFAAEAGEAAWRSFLPAALG